MSHHRGPPWNPPGSHHHHPPPGHHHPPPHHAQPFHHYQIPAPPPIPFFLPGSISMPYYPRETTQQRPKPTYITNYIYHGDSNPNSAQPIPDPSSGCEPETQEIVQVAETSGDFDWVPTTSTLAGHLTGRAIVGGHEGWDGSPLWIIRSSHDGDLIPGKLSVRHNAAAITYNGKEVPVQNIEVLCCKENSLRWVPGSNGSVPPSAIPGGHTASGEPLYVGRAKYQMSLTPGKIHPSHKACYISFTGTEVAMNMYDVLCRLS